MTSSSLIKVSTLCLILLIAFTVRLLPIRWGLFLSEFDPYFHYRSAEYMVENGIQSWNSWNDYARWYPFGNSPAKTSYPGLAISAYFLFSIANILGFSISLYQLCILFPAVMGTLTCLVEFLKKDGSRVPPGTPIMSIDGPAQSILSGERTALNLLMRMSGIASATKRLVEKISDIHSNVRIACTRKTAPGLRFFDKKAVEIGGGDTHRLRLDDAILIKTNHLRLVGSIKSAVREAKAKGSFTKKIEVEVETRRQAIDAAEAGVDIIMLDNLEPKEIRETLRELEKRKLRKRVLIEASGGITEDNIMDYATTGVDVISIGALTHSIHAINLNLLIEKK